MFEREVRGRRNFSSLASWSIPCHFGSFFSVSLDIMAGVRSSCCGVLSLRRSSVVCLVLCTCVFPSLLSSIFVSLPGCAEEFFVRNVAAEEATSSSTIATSTGDRSSTDSGAVENLLEQPLPEDQGLDLEGELKAELDRIKTLRDASSTTTTAAPPENVFLDAGKEAGMGVWHAFTAPFRLLKNLVVHPRRTVNTAVASAGVTFGKLGEAARATIQGGEGVGRAWREAGRDLVRAATMHPERERNLEKIAALESARSAHENLVRMRSSAHDQAVADEQLKRMLGYDENRSEEVRKEVEQQRQRFMRYQKMKEEEEARKKEKGGAAVIDVPGHQVAGDR